METLKLRSTHGMAKASGILLCIGGVIVLALYQGPELKSLNHHQLLSHHAVAHAHNNKNWALGIFLMTTSVVIWSLWTVQQVTDEIYVCVPEFLLPSLGWYVLMLLRDVCHQGPLLLEYPSKLLNTTLQCVFASVQSFVIALVLERDFSRWKLAGGVSLASVLFTVSTSILSE
jgi:hypothetical protein